jgi:hypothetical protein
VLSVACAIVPSAALGDDFHDARHYAAPERDIAAVTPFPGLTEPLDRHGVCSVAIVLG